MWSDREDERAKEVMKSWRGLSSSRAETAKQVLGGYANVHRIPTTFAERERRDGRNLRRASVLDVERDAAPSLEFLARL